MPSQNEVYLIVSNFAPIHDGSLTRFKLKVEESRAHCQLKRILFLDEDLELQGD